MSQDSFHPSFAGGRYVAVILPIAVPKTYTYFVPATWIPQIQVGVRVEVQLGRNKRYAALIENVDAPEPEGYRAKPILSVIDPAPIASPAQLAFWKWLADYYACTIGEVMSAALPAGFRLASETRVTLSPLFDDNYEGLSDKEYYIAEALRHQKELSLEDIRKILDQKTVYPLIQKLLDKRLIYLKEELKNQYKPKVVRCVAIAEPYASDPNQLSEAFDRLSRSSRQVEAMMALLQVVRQKEVVRCQEIYRLAQVDSGVLKAMEKKGVVRLYSQAVSRIGAYEEALADAAPLSAQQVEALASIEAQFADKRVILLHGVTGSGKTRVYTELIQQTLDRGEQVLYLLPEIALSAQITRRLQKIFGDQALVYHSRLSNHERVEMWQKVLEGKPLLIGVRSSLFLPFQKLGLIIVDEEHDTSYKQVDPAPRYNARDTAIYLGQVSGAKVLLGTATPAIETYHNAQRGKYGLVEMPERFGGVELPEMQIIDAGTEQRHKKMHSHFTNQLLDALREALDRGEQAILFKNRRGYAPTLRCVDCNWHSECKNCDVSLTYYQYSQNLRCHYCGFQRAMPKSCPACGSHQLVLRGFGTEKIEDELKILLPKARIRRMDFDTVRGKYAHAQIIGDFEERRIDVLVGTQMVTKGLDFDNVGIVGVLSSDHLLQFPDFRASERAFQLITQVSGRAGRKRKRGKVLIQAFDLQHPILPEVLNNDFAGFFQRELQERAEFFYPPYSRLIQITLKHKSPELLNEGAKLFVGVLRQHLGERVIGPAVPGIPRVRNLFLLDVLLKLERQVGVLARTKQLIREASRTLHAQKGFSSVRVRVDVDPY
ncbi:MAG: primosomal protein N' [Bacteroidota bacterium]